MCPIHGFDDCDLGKRDGNTTQEPMALVEEGEYDIDNEILQERPI